MNEITDFIFETFYDRIGFSKESSYCSILKLGKFNLKINVIPNKLQKYVGFTINDKLSFIDSFQEFDNNLLYLLKQKGFYPYEYMSDFENSKEELPSKEKFYSYRAVRKITESKNTFLMFGKKIEKKTMKDYHDLYLKYDVLLLANVFEKFRSNSSRVIDYIQISI